MVIVEEYTQNELYFLDNKLEARDVFLERVQDNINRVINGKIEKLVDIKYLIDNDNLRHCLVTYNITKQEYKNICD